MKAKEHNVPVLRFPEFSGNWNINRIRNYISRVGVPVNVEPEKLYREIGIRSHGKGLFHKEPVTGESLGNKRVFRVHVPAFVVNIVFAWEHAIAVTSDKEEGFIASHRFPMFVPVDGKSTLPFVRYFFLREHGKHLLELASPGGAGRNKTLGQKDFEKLKVVFPEVAEQQKIASFLTAVDSKIEQLSKKKALLEQYKKGLMQKIFSQEMRFKDEQGNDFPDWEEKRLWDVATFSKGKGISKDDISENGSLECIRYGQLYTDYAETIRDIKSRTNIPIRDTVLSEPNDIIIPASGETQIDIATASCVLKGGVALGGDLNIIRTEHDGVFISYYLNNNKKYEIARLAQGISVVHLYAAQLKLLQLNLPSILEQRKISSFLSSIDKKIDLISTELTHAKTFKKGLLQQMFV